MTDIAGTLPGSPALRQLSQQSLSGYVEQVRLCVDINTQPHCVLHQLCRAEIKNRASGELKRVYKYLLRRSIMEYEMSES